MLSGRKRSVIDAYEKGYRVDENGNLISFTDKRRKTREDSDGYLGVSYRVDGECSELKVHQLMAYQKFGGRFLNEDLVVRHLDGDPSNNEPENIALGTPSQNAMDKPKEQRIKDASNPQYDYGAIKEFYKETESYKQTMEEFDISSKGTLHYILNN